MNGTETIDWNDFIAAIAKRDRGNGEGLQAHDLARATNAVLGELLERARTNPVGVLQFVLKHGASG